jgi:hypothetical protein
MVAGGGTSQESANGKPGVAVNGNSSFTISPRRIQKQPKHKNKPMKTNVIKSSLLLAVATSLALSAGAQLTLTGTNYRQTFDGIGSGLPVEWLIYTNAKSTQLGTPLTFNPMPTNWAKSTFGFGNYASTLNGGTNLLGTEAPANQYVFTNRALGLRTTGAADPGAAFVLKIDNTRGLKNFTLDLDFLLLSVQNRTNVWTVDYGLGSNPDNFLAMGTYTALGNGNGGVFGATRKTFSFGQGLNDQPGPVFIRIVNLSPSGLSTGSSGSRPTVGIDNFSLSFTSALPFITGIIITNGGVQIDFTGNPGDTVSSFILLGANPVAGAFNDAGATISQISPGIFRARCGLNDAQQFYRIKHQ